MEQEQELKSLDKTIMADVFHESSNSEPETWYKIVTKDVSEAAGDLLSHSEDEQNLSPSTNLTRPILCIKVV